MAMEEKNKKVDEKKDALLNDAIKAIEKQYGKGSIMNLGNALRLKLMLSAAVLLKLMKL